LWLILVAVKNSYTASKAMTMMATLSTGVSKKLSTTISTAIPTSAESTLVFIKTSPFYRQRINSGLVQGMRLVHCTELPAQLTQVFPLSAGFPKPVIF